MVSPPEYDIIADIIRFFEEVFEVRSNDSGYLYADYKTEWLNFIGLKESSADESKTARTTKKLQEYLVSKYGDRIKVEAKVAENMTLRFNELRGENETKEIDIEKLQAFDLLDIENGVAVEISLADAFAEFFKDVLKALLDSRVKKLYLCMRNHYYKGAKKSGYIKVASSPMVKQYIALARLYKLEIVLLDLCPAANPKP